MVATSRHYRRAVRQLALHGANWVDIAAPLRDPPQQQESSARPAVRGDRIEDDEVVLIDGIPVATPARVALDLGCWYPTGEAVAAIDDLSGAANLKMTEVELLSQRYPGRRGIHLALGPRSILWTLVRSRRRRRGFDLLLIRAGLPRPRTQIPVCDEIGDVVAYLDMGWDDVKVAVEYDGYKYFQSPDLYDNLYLYFGDNQLTSQILKCYFYLIANHL